MALEIPQMVRPTNFKYALYFDFKDFRIKYDWEQLYAEMCRLDPNALARLQHLVEDLMSYGLNVCIPDRIRTQQAAYYSLLECRLVYLNALGTNFLAAFRPRPAMVPRPAATERDSDEMLERKFEEMQQRGVFDPQSYTTNHATYKSLVEFVRTAQSIEAEVIIVIMPIMSRLRFSTPPVATQSIHELLHENFGAKAPRVVDLYQSVPDDQFMDYIHVNARGAKSLNDLFVQKLSDPSPR